MTARGMIDADLVARARDADIVSAAERLGAVLKRVSSAERAGGCPKCGGRDRFAVNVKKRLWHCRGCGKGGNDALSLVQHVLACDFPAAVEFLTGEDTRAVVISRPRPATDKGDNRATALALWRRRRPVVEGDPVWRYLREARGYDGPIPATLGFLPGREEHPPALIAAVGLADEPEPGVLAISDSAVRAVHLVRLKPDGSGKAGTDVDKLTIGEGSLGTPVVVAPPNDLLGLAIVEGIEDGVSVHAATGLGVWAALGAGRMPALAAAVPAYIDCVTVCAHRDAGERDARELVARLDARSIEIFLKFLDEESAPWP